MSDDPAPSRVIMTAVFLSLAMVLLLALCGGCTSRPVQQADTRYTPTNLDELDQAAERLLIAEVEAVDAVAEIEAGPEVVW